MYTPIRCVRKLCTLQRWIMLTAITWVTVFAFSHIYIAEQNKAERKDRMYGRTGVHLDEIRSTSSSRDGEKLERTLLERFRATSRSNTNQTVQEPAVDDSGASMGEIRMNINTISVSLPCIYIDQYDQLLSPVDVNTSWNHSLLCQESTVSPLDPRTETLAQVINDSIVKDTCLTSKKVPRDTPTWPKSAFLTELLRNYRVTAIFHKSFVKRQRAENVSDVTMLTQCDETRFPTFQKVAERWVGPIIVAIYVTSENTAKFLKDAAAWQLDNRPRTNIVMLIVQRVGPLYPINRLRNLPLFYAKTEYAFVHDMDFLPSLNMYQQIMKHVNTGVLNYTGAKPRALVVPAFDITDDVDPPSSKDDAVRLMQKKKMWQFHKKFNDCGHKYVDYTRWCTSGQIYDIKRNPKCFHCFEPYIVLKTQESPIFPELFAERGKNKLPYYSELCQRKVLLKVLPDVFLVHLVHKPESYKYFDPAVPGFNKHLGGCIDASWDGYTKLQKAKDWH